MAYDQSNFLTHISFLVDKPDLPGLQPRIAEAVIQKDYGPQFWLTAEFRSIFSARMLYDLCGVMLAISYLR